MLSKPDYLMVNVSDMSRSIAFYRDLLGLKLRFDSPGWTEFDTGSTTLALHATSSPAPPRDPARREPPAGTCSFGFSVDDVSLQ